MAERVEETKRHPLEEAALPATVLEGALPHLRRPFSPAAVKWKIQTSSDKGGIVVGYIDARLVVERLNLVIPNWWDRYEPYGERIDSGLLVCHLTVDGVCRSDVGKGQGNDPVKAAYSDSLKRAGVKFGIGVSLYAMRAIWLGATSDGEIDSNGAPTLRKREKRGKTIAELTKGCEAWLRESYAKWLEEGSGQVFGPVLDHGDVEGSAGALLEGGAEAAAEDETNEELTAAAEREELEKLYEEKIASQNGKRSKLTKGKFQAQLRAADSPEKLGELRARIEEAAK
jgi:hypothetical protein